MKSARSVKLLCIKTFLLLLLCWCTSVFADNIIEVKDANELKKALLQAEPGTMIILKSGDYGNGIYARRVNGTREKPIIITGESEKDCPVFEGGKEAIHFVACNYIILRGIKVIGCKENGINADDGRIYDIPSKGMMFENITIQDIGPTGIKNGLKISGLDNFIVRGCKISGWGGSAIDMVGCHNGIIEGCQIIGKKNFSQSSGIQVKGGSEKIIIKKSFFKNAGRRAINLGGKTGLQFFRPMVRDYEAKDIEVAGNYFIGSRAPIAYVTSIDSVVRQNTIVYPEKWVIRILQEQPINKFKESQGGVFENNLVIFDKRVKKVVNIGPNTKPGTFIFRENAWFCSDEDRRPSLPSKEIGGIYQVDPMLHNPETSGLRARPRNPRMKNIGAHAFKN